MPPSSIFILKNITISTNMKNYILLSLLSIFLFSCTKEILQHKLTVDVSPANGGSVTPPSNSYEKGQSLQLLATPAGEYVLKAWKGDLVGIANPSTLVINQDKQVTGLFEKRQYPLNLTIEGNGTIKEEIIAVASQSQYPSGTTVRLTPQPLEGWAFTGWSGDLASTANPLDIKVDKPISLKASFSKLNITSIKIENPIDTLIISQKYKYKVVGTYANGSKIDISTQVKLSCTPNLTLVDNISFVGAKSGSASIKITFENQSIDVSLFINNFEEILSKVHQDFRTVNSSAGINVPVVIINFHPTIDGINIDPRRYLDDYFIKDRFYTYYGLDRNVCSNSQKDNPICKTGTLEMYKIRAQDIHSLTKFAIEEGSKYRGFDNPNASKNINVQVVKYFNFYELKTKIYSSRPDVPQPDYQDIFKKINLEALVNNLGVKEVWFSMPPLSVEYPSIQQGLISRDLLLNMPESNMSSPSGDISNSERDQNDLPVYKNTYVVYGVNIDRGPSEAVHNRGHQIESQLRFIEKDKNYPNELFWNKFVGVRTSGRPMGRAGMTHFPPNTSVDYDYANTTLIDSDIRDWKPEGGNLTKVNVETWLKKTYNFPQNIFWADNNVDKLRDDSGYKWFIYWFQAFPSLNNNIGYKLTNGTNTRLSNWWDLFYNWDNAVKNKKTLWIE